MNTKKLWYWITTAWVVGIMTITGGLSVAHAKTMMEGFAHLGYPAYFANLLGVAKLLGVCALLAPRLARIKEWAYAGFAITIVSASYSHLNSGDGLKSLEPLATLAALAVSYWGRPVDCRVFLLPAIHALQTLWSCKTRGGAMKLVILGATGGVGLEIVRQAIARGYSVTALVRSPERLKPFQDRIAIEQRDPLNSCDLGRVLQGHNAVLSAFGPRVPVAKTDAHLLRDFAVALTAAMQHASVRRVVVVSTAFLFRDSIIPPTYLFGRLFFPAIVIDAEGMERTIRESELDWTIVRPPQLTDKGRSGKYRVREGHLPSFGFSISRADVADCFIKALDNSTSVKKILGVSN